MNTAPEAPARDSLLLVISGPTASGKTTVCHRLLEAFAPRLQRVVTATTRPPREGECAGIDYHFLAEEEFLRRVEAGEFYEYARVHDRYYGTLKAEVHRHLDASRDVLLNIDVQGADAYRQAARQSPDGPLRSLVTVFIRPARLEILRERLRKRGDTPEAEIERRLQTAEAEIGQWRRFDYCLTTGAPEADFDALRSIYLAEQCRSTRIHDLET